MSERIAAPLKLRRLWLGLHRWIALALGSVLILSGMTGAALVAARPLDRSLHPDYFVAGGHLSSIGAFLAWRPIGGWITALSNESPTPVPILHPAPGAMLPLNDLAARAKAVFPGGLIGYITIPPQSQRLLRIRVRTADDPHPNGQSVVWLDSSTGRILARHRWNMLDPGKRANAVVYPLHTGELGGPLLQAVIALTGLVLGMLGISGLWLWWRRRASRVAASRAG